jgi:hypothetical protein
VIRAISRSYECHKYEARFSRVMHSHSSSVLAMAKIVQALTLLSLVSRAFAVTAYLYDVIQCPSNNYISTVCSNLRQLSCCTDYHGVRSICFYISYISDFPTTIVLYLERNTLRRRRQLLYLGNRRPSQLHYDKISSRFSLSLGISERPLRHILGTRTQCRCPRQHTRDDS